MKDGKVQTQIAQLMDRDKSTISFEFARNTGNQGYRSGVQRQRVSIARVLYKKADVIILTKQPTL